MSNFFENTRKPQGLGGKVMVKMMNCGHTLLANFGLSNLNLFEEANVLDIGCGGGANITRLLKQCCKGTVTGIDYSEVSVASSTKKNQEAIHEGRCKVLQGNVSALPFDENTFDYVTAFETIYFWPEIEKSFHQVRHVLKPDGTFMICNELDGLNAKDDKWLDKIEGMTIYSKEQIETYLKKLGFQEISVVHEAKKHWLCIKAKK